jgi:hypothetical protein
VAPVVGDEPGEGQPLFWSIEQLGCRLAVEDGDVGVLPGTPVDGGLLTEVTIATLEQAGVRVRQVTVTVLRRHTVAEALPGVGHEPSRCPG